MTEKYVDPFEDDTQSLVDAATEINRASELTGTNPENTRETMIHQRYVDNTLKPKENGEQYGNSN